MQKQKSNKTPFKRILPFLELALIVSLWLMAQWQNPTMVQAADRAIAGRIIDEQGAPVREAEVALFVNGEDEPLSESRTQPDGSYLLLLQDSPPIEDVRIEIERAHFESFQWEAEQGDLDALIDGGSLVLDDITLTRRLQLGFWIVSITFLGMLALVATERIHRTLAALLAIAIIFGVSFVGGTFNPDLFIFDFDQALEHVDFDVIFLLMGMMIVIAIIEETGIFQWLAYQAYRLSGGRAWQLTIILILITAVSSALLDNVTTMLLMTPITLQIALAMEIDPLSLLLPEVLASNVGGISTLIGTPTNILIGSYAGLSFNDFFINLTPGVLLALLGLIGYALLYYRKEYRKSGTVSESLLKILEENAQIEDPRRLFKSGVVFGVLLFLFIIGESIHLPPAASAIMGAVAMLIWVNPDIESMLAVVDWTTLMFFIGLFMVIGAVQEVGLIFLIASGLGEFVAGKLLLALLVVVWSAAILSGIVDNIPFAAAMLPVVSFLTETVPGADSLVLFYGLSVGAAMGGNSSLIGASANLVTAGIAERAGYKISFKKFLFVGFPSMIVSVTLALGWLLLRFLV
jgi:Na+/H+ antiporter NhaD/arsenite permease-like protein